MFRIIPLQHTSDTAFRIEASSREELVRGSIRALAELLELPPTEMSAGEAAPGKKAEEEITVTGGESAEMLVDLLNEWLFLVQQRGFLPGEMDIRWSEKELTAGIRGTCPDPPSNPAVEVKAVTYHAAEVIPPEGDRNTWTATWIADI